MHFTFAEIKELSLHLRNFRISQESEGSKTTLALLQAVESKLSLALSRSTTNSKTTTLELDSEQLLILSRAIVKARPELVSKIQHTIFLQSTSEAFDIED